MNVDFNYEEAGPITPIYFEQVHAEKPGGGRVANPTRDIPPATAVYLNSKGLYEPVRGFRLVEGVKVSDTSIKVAKECVIYIKLTGVYPKDFKFVGWHPFCRCFATPKQADRSEVNKWARMTGEERKDYRFKGTVDALPKQFNTWVGRNKDRIAKAKTLPYFLQDNKEIIERAAKIETRRTLYNKYKNDNNYKDVVFDEVGGGFMATHIEHNIDKNKGWYETTVQKNGYQNGHKVILEKEDHSKLNKKNTEGTWDDLYFEIAAAENATANNIRNSLKHCASKPSAEVAVIFFPNDNFNRELFEQGFAKYNGLKGTSQYRLFKYIYCIDKNKIILTKKARAITLAGMKDVSL